jgi:hypothetical protein
MPQKKIDALENDIFYDDTRPLRGISFTLRLQSFVGDLGYRHS